MSTPELPDRVSLEAFLAACEAGDAEAVRTHLERDPTLASARHRGTTGLHLAVGSPEVLGLLLAQGADPNARDDGDHALPLHFAAGGGPLEAVRALLDAGSDVQGEGDFHGLDVIGWATAFAEARTDVVHLLVERGARHNVFSAIAMGDPDLVRSVVARDPASLGRRLGASEQEQTPLHYVVAPPDGLTGGRFRTGEHYRTLEVLIELGAELEARDSKGRTPLTLAMLRGDAQAMRLLHGAGAKAPEPTEAGAASVSALRASMGKIVPMLAVSDVGASIAWYGAVGFDVTASHGVGGALDWAHLAFGEAELMLVPAGGSEGDVNRPLSLWITTDRLDELYEALKGEQLRRARARLAGEEPAGPEVRITADLHTTFYGQREFGVVDPDGVELMFAQPVESSARS